jgi:hypothetical protein
VLLPLALIGQAAWSYVNALAETIQDPGVPAKYDYKTPGGTITGWVDRFKVSVASGTVEIWGASATAEGQRLARVDHAFVSGIHPQEFLATGGFSAPITADVEGVFARIDRDRDGKLALQKFFPPAKGEPSRIPFQVTARKIQLVYQDQAPKSLGRPLQVIVPTVMAAGIGDDWQASATLNIVRGGTVRVVAQQLIDKSITGTAVTNRLNLEPLLSAGLGADLPPSLRIGDTIASGNARFTRTSDGKLAIRAPIEVQSTDVAYDGNQVANARIKGVVSERGFAGSVSAERSRSRVQFEGALSLATPLTVGGKLNAQLASLADVPSQYRKSIPPNLRVSAANFAGSVSYRGNKQPDWRVAGRAGASAIEFAKEKFGPLEVPVGADPRVALVDASRGVSWNQMRATGWGSYQISDGSVLAVASTDPVSLEKVPPAYRRSDVKGNVAAKLVAEGPIKQLMVRGVAQGNVRYQPRGKSEINLGAVVAAASYRDGKLLVQRGTATGGVGLATVWPAGDGTLRVNMRGIPLELLDPKLMGTGNVAANVVPDLKNPRVTGRAEAYGLAYGTTLVPVVAANFVADRTTARITELTGLRGTAVVTGRAAYRFSDQRLWGLADIDNLQASDLNEELLVGTVDVKNVRLVGTASQPKVTFGLEADELVAGGVKASMIRVPGAYESDQVTLGMGTASVLGGDVKVSGNYNLKQKTGAGEVDFNSLSLSNLGAEAGTSFTLAGIVSGSARVSIADSRVSTGNVDANLKQFALNQAPFGSGKVALEYDGKTYRADGEIGQLDRYITMSRLEYSPTADGSNADIRGNVEVSDFPAADLISLAQKQIDALPYEQRSVITSAKAVVSFGGEVSGTMKQPDLQVKVLEAKSINVSDTDFGTLTVSGDFTKDTYKVKTLALDGLVAKVNLSGSATKDGPIAVDGEVRNLQLAALRRFVPGLSSVTGSVNVPFVVSGQTNKPELLASLETEGFLQRKGDPRDLAMNISLDRVAISERIGDKGGIDVAGVWKYRGFQGAISATAPFAYPFEIPETGAVSAQITLADRPLRDIAELSDTLDPKRTEGSIKGSISASGSVAKIDWLGGVEFRASKLGWKASDITFENVVANAYVNPNRLGVDVKAAHAGGGSIEGELFTPTDPIAQLFGKLSEGGWQEVLDSQLTGKVALKDFRHRQKLEGAQSVSGRGDGEITISGPARSPLIAGELNLSNVDGSVSALGAGSSSAEPPLIDPRFKIQVNLVNPARIRAATADLSILGRVELDGKFTAPLVSSVLTVEKGTFRLPGGLVRIGQGGSVRFDYDGSNLNPPTLLVDVDGRSSVTTAVTGNTLDRYDVLISITGDLLKEGGLVFEASSDPPGLSQERIIGLLGQTDLLSGIGSDADRSQTTQQLQNAFTSFAIPVVFERLTEGLAQSLYLDYITVDYNPFDRVSLIIARSLGSGFSIQARRQISEPDPGQPIKYDVRLVYRPRRFRGFLSRFSLSVGADELRPFKISADYSTRFGRSYNGATKAATVIFPDRPKVRAGDPPGGKK